ncbi:hypothetical protein [Streptomyces olivoreticuli]|uniref:hypothetical protein n=1 Tax=Streptomyces olivoreticuli TaxID=68246 RepID=UPI0013C2D15E|nr:hypothetical protein [Streptomyces olivoreticuli]
MRSAAREDGPSAPRVSDDRLKVLGAAVGGAAIGWAGLEIQRWADAAESRVCRRHPLDGCLTLYPEMGIAGWIAVTLVGFVVLLWVLDVRPLAGTVTACLALSLCTLMTWADVGGLARSWIFYALSAAGPGLVAAIRSPRMRLPASIALAVLLAPLVVWLGWRAAR